MVQCSIVDSTVLIQLSLLHTLLVPESMEPRLHIEAVQACELAGCHLLLRNTLQGHLLLRGLLLEPERTSHGLLLYWRSLYFSSAEGRHRRHQTKSFPGQPRVVSAGEGLERGVVHTLLIIATQRVLLPLRAYFDLGLRAVLQQHLWTVSPLLLLLHWVVLDGGLRFNANLIHFIHQRKF